MYSISFQIYKKKSIKQVSVKKHFSNLQQIQNQTTRFHSFMMKKRKKQDSLLKKESTLQEKQLTYQIRESKNLKKKTRN